eukprot:TRINITY_DN28511_c0_g1_i1.p1 TRINITY_DN28511_c0_g1~~TRINITY_DN28511_c0_g1_i1.p1  ORF type:complete len:422 (+),score=163.14 TRINITY_DN28511_c0_g1_i1:101-1366(+)
MAAAALPQGSAAEDEEELCKFLREQVRALEQRQMAQMRQSSSLQRKVETAEAELAKVREAARPKERKERPAAQSKARTSASAASAAAFGAVAGAVQSAISSGRASAPAASRGREALHALEADLQQRMRHGLQRKAGLEKEAQAARASRRAIEADVAYWRYCGGELSAPTASSSSTAPASDRGAASSSLQELLQGNERLQSQHDVIVAGCASLKEQAVEVERLSQTSRAQEDKLRLRNAQLQREISEAKAAAAKLGAKTTADRELEAVLHKETQRLQAQLLEERRNAAELQGGEAQPDAAEGGAAKTAPSAPTKEQEQRLAYLNKKVQEEEKQLDALKQENGRLQGALRRHAGLEGGYRPMTEQRNKGYNDLMEDNTCGSFDEGISWTVMLLFKSILARRFFFVHMAILYSWGFILLCYTAL